MPTQTADAPATNGNGTRLASDLTPDERRRLATGAMKRVTSAVLGEPPTATGQVTKLYRQYKGLANGLPWEILDYVELLATWNPDYSQAVENIKMLANSGHQLFVDADSELQKRKIKDFLEEKARKIQESHGGIDGIMDKMIKQGAVFGAMCGEWVLNDELTEVVDFADISPKAIRFFWDDNLQQYIPHQKLDRKQAEKAKKEGRKLVNDDCVELNPLTFRYYAFDPAPESPYGVPPFLAALTNISIQRDMIHNMAQIVKKIGLLGVIDLTIERLDPLPGETDEEYVARCRSYLEEYVAVAEDMAKDGGIVHFDDVVANSWQIGGNAAGATNLHKANEEMIFSGLKSMPSVQGRSYSTTETYAGVAYDIILRNTYKYQKAAKRMVESGYWLMCAMAGLNPKNIRIEWNENRSLNRLQEAQAEKSEIENSWMLWVMGIIDQVIVSQRHGYAEPKTPMAEAPPLKGGGQSSGGENGEGSEGDTPPADRPPAENRVSDFGGETKPRGNMEDADEEDEPGFVYAY